MTRKIAVIGLDSVPPSLLFDRLLVRLPNFRRLYKCGLHGGLTCDPLITVPAWMAMMTGKKPGRLGIYGFRHRKPRVESVGLNLLEEPPLKEAEELVDCEPRISYYGPQRPLCQFPVVGHRHPAVRFFLLSHDDMRTGLMVNLEPCPR